MIVAANPWAPASAQIGLVGPQGRTTDMVSAQESRASDRHAFSGTHGTLLKTGAPQFEADRRSG